MQISPNYNFNNIKSYNPSLKRKENICVSAPVEKPSNDDITLARLKRALSECRYVVIAAGILYFGIKKTFRNSETVNQAIERNIISKLKKPEINLPV